MNRYGLTVLVALLAACDTAPTTMTTDAGPMLRGGRYCEILRGTLTGGNLHVKVYNTVGVSDCPQDGWSMLDTTALKASTSSDLGFTFRTRTLAADLVVRALNHQATVLQDDNLNTYLESQ